MSAELAAELCEGTYSSGLSVSCGQGTHPLGLLVGVVYGSATIWMQQFYHLS